MRTRALLTAACFAAAHASTAPSGGTLYAFAIRSLTDDDHELAQVMLIDPTTGSRTWLGKEFAFAASDSSSLDWCVVRLFAR
jgi:hypothetical protein